jgi:hypothetical protein
MLYISYVARWWHDAINFKPKQSRSFDILPGSTQSLLTRIDTQEYVIALERRLGELGIDVVEMQSNYGVHRALWDL